MAEERFEEFDLEDMEQVSGGLEFHPELKKTVTSEEWDLLQRMGYQSVRG